MRKTFLCAVAAFLANSGAALESQAAGSTLRVNPQVGVGTLLFTNDPELHIDSPRVGYRAGAFVRYGGRFYVQPGAFLEQTSVQVQDIGLADIEGDEIEDAVKTLAIHLPLLGGAHIFQNIRAEFGPAITVIASVDDNALGFTTDTFASPTIGFLFSSGMNFHGVTLDASFELGFGRVFERGAGDDFEPDTRRSTFRITLGWLL